MNIQIYFAKKNPDVLKAERFFKERKISYQLVDLAKHKLGRKELELFLRAAGDAGARSLIEREGKKALERPVAHMTTDSLILSELVNDPTALKSPIVRNGNKITIGADEQVWKGWLSQVS